MVSPATAICVVLSASLSQLAAAQGLIPERIAAALEANARSLAPIKLVLNEQYSTPYPDGIARQLNMDDAVLARLLRSRKRTIARDGVALFLRTEERVLDGWEIHECAFDGQVYYNGSPTATFGNRLRPDLRRTPVASMDPSRPLWTLDYFADIGYRLPRTAGALARHEPIRSELLALLDSGGALRVVSSEVQGDRSVVRIEIESPNPAYKAVTDEDVASLDKELRSVPGRSGEWIEAQLSAFRERARVPATIISRFYLDPDYNYGAIATDQMFQDGRFLKRVITSNWESVGNRDVWLPKEVNTQFYAYETAPTVVHDRPALLRKQEVDGYFQLLALPASTFVLSYLMPDTLVIDETNGTQLAVTMPSGPASLDRAINQVIDDGASHTRSAETPAGWDAVGVNDRSEVKRLKRRATAPTSWFKSSWGKFAAANVFAALVVLFVMLRRASKRSRRRFLMRTWGCAGACCWLSAAWAVAATGEPTPVDDVIIRSRLRMSNAAVKCWIIEYNAEVSGITGLRDVAVHRMVAGQRPSRWAFTSSKGRPTDSSQK